MFHLIGYLALAILILFVWGILGVILMAKLDLPEPRSFKQHVIVFFFIGPLFYSETMFVTIGEWIKNFYNR